MPIADTEGYPSGHWLDVREIIYQAVRQAGFEPNLVSFDIGVSTIHKTIVQNLYFNDIVVCDISSRNANVMFELGMRLAFDKPTVIIKDDNTPYSFDIAGIEHLNYPHDLRYKNIEKFKENLASKIKNTISAFNKDPDNFSVFLKHFGDFTVPKLEQKEVGFQEVILDEIKELKNQLNEINSPKAYPEIKNEFQNYLDDVSAKNQISFNLSKNIDDNKITEIMNNIKNDLQINFDYKTMHFLDSNIPTKLILTGKFTPGQRHRIKYFIDVIANPS